MNNPDACDLLIAAGWGDHTVPPKTRAMAEAGKMPPAPAKSSPAWRVHHPNSASVRKIDDPQWRQERARAGARAAWPVDLGAKIRPLLASGKRNIDIARELGVSHQVVRYHRKKAQ